MSLGYMGGKLLSVGQVIETHEFDDQVVAVRGILHLERWGTPFFCIHKDGPFDGAIPDAEQLEAERRVIRIDEPDLEKRFGPVGNAVGGYIYKYDSVVVGRICRHPDVTAITDLWMILMQRTDTFPNCPDVHRFGAMGFPSSRTPQVPWTGLVARTGNAFLKTEPIT